MDTKTIKPAHREPTHRERFWTYPNPYPTVQQPVHSTLCP